MTTTSTTTTSPDDVALAVSGLAGEDETSAVEQDQLHLPKGDVQAASVEVGEVPGSVQLFRELASGSCNQYNDCSRDKCSPGTFRQLSFTYKFRPPLFFLFFLLFLNLIFLPRLRAGPRVFTSFSLSFPSLFFYPFVCLFLWFQTFFVGALFCD